MLAYKYSPWKDMYVSRISEIRGFCSARTTKSSRGVGTVWGNVVASFLFSPSGKSGPIRGNGSIVHKSQ